MAASHEFTDFLCEHLSDFGPVQARPMFGGAGLFRDGLMFGLVADDVLFFKADDQNRHLFEAEDLPPFSYETKKGKRGVMSYMRAPERCLDDRDDMSEWARSAFEAALRENAKRSTKSAKSQ